MRARNSAEQTAAETTSIAGQRDVAVDGAQAEIGVEEHQHRADDAERHVLWNQRCRAHESECTEALAQR